MPTKGVFRLTASLPTQHSRSRRSTSPAPASSRLKWPPLPLPRVASRRTSAPPWLPAGIAIPANIHHASLAPAGVGSTLEGVPLSTKVNVNLGISGDLADEALEWEKVDVALELGADAIMDLSNSGQDPRLPPRAR